MSGGPVLASLQLGQSPCTCIRVGTKEAALPPEKALRSDKIPHQSMVADSFPSHEELATWFEDKLRAERVSIEQNHRIIINDFAKAFGRLGGDRMSEQTQNNRTASEARTIERVWEQPSVVEALEKAPVSEDRAKPIFVQAPTKERPTGSHDSDDSDMLRGSANGDKASVENCIMPPEIARTSSCSAHLDLESIAEEVNRRVDQIGSKKFCEDTDEPSSPFASLNTRIELSIALVILANIFVMMLERQYIGFDVGHASIGYRNYRPADETWPWARGFFEFAEIAFGIIFIFDVLLMLYILRVRFFTSLWHLFDASIVLCWLVVMLGKWDIIVDPILFRMSKLMRLLRLLRLSRAIHMFDILHLMVTACFASFMVVAWSVILLALVIVVASLCVNQFLQGFLEDIAHPLSERIKVFEQWGTVSRSIETMFEVTLGNWGPPCRMLQDHVSEWWIVFFIGYKCIIGFCVVQVISSVFIQQTFKCVSKDEDRMLVEKQKQTEEYLQKLLRVFKLIDVSGDGFLSPEEVDLCLCNKTVQAWFGALDVDIKEASRIFTVIDDGDGFVSREEFLHGVKLCATTAKSIDSQMLLMEIRSLSQTVASMAEQKCFTVKDRRRWLRTSCGTNSALTLPPPKAEDVAAGREITSDPNDGD